MRRPLSLLPLLAAAAAVTVSAAPPPPAVFLHLSDIHYSTNVHKYWRSFGDRESDAALWAQRVLPRLAPQAVLVTGDITDSKTARGDGLQQEAEWLAYAALLRNLTAAGVPLARVWDLPGNHDVFNMPLRGGANDFFSKHAAEGRRRASHQQRVYMHRLERPEAAEGAAGEGAGCPAAWALGLDPTPEPGLRSPTNFAGQAPPALLAETRAALGSVAEQAAAAGCGPPLILAYCHYPLSTIDSAPQRSPGPLGVLGHASRSALAMQGLTRLLAEHNVSAVLSGHLHSAFGQRLHRLHATPSGGWMAELETAAWKDDRRFRVLALDGGALSFAELQFHTRNSPRMPARSDAAAMRDPAWLDAYERRGWAVTALDPTAAVIDHVALITSPPDGRYSPLGGPRGAAGMQQQQQDGEAEGAQQAGWVRALVLPLDEAAPQPAEPEVELAGFLPSGVRLFSKKMQAQQAQQAAAAGGGGLLFAAQGETTVSCVSARTGGPAAECYPPADQALIQVSVKGPSGRTSRSPQQPVALHCRALTASHQRCWVAPVAQAPLALGVTTLEWLGLAFNWPVAVHRLFLCVWAAQVGLMLVAPRLLAARVLPAVAASPLFQAHPADQLPTTPKGAAANGGLAGAAARTLRSATAFLLWPFVALFHCATVTEVWAAMLAFSAYLLVGPHLAYAALSPGYPPAWMFHFGVLGRLDLGGIRRREQQGGDELPAWAFVGTCDTMFAVLVHACFCLLPATLWVACVVARRLQLQHYYSPVSRSSSRDSSASGEARQRMEAGGGSAASLAAARGGARSRCLGGAAACSRWSFSGPQVAAWLALAAFNWATLYRRAGALMTWAAVLLSPGFAWTLPFAALLVVAWGGPRRPCGWAAKGE